MENPLKKILLLLIATAMTTPVLAMHNQVTPMVTINPSSTTQESTDGVIVLPKRNDTDTDYNLNLGEIESLSTEPFADLISQAHIAGKDYLLARVDTASNGHTHCFDANKLNGILKPNARDFRPSLIYNNPVNREPIADAHYFAIDRNNTCTYKCSYNDFVERRRSLAEWNALFPDALVINNPLPTETDLEAARNTLINRYCYNPFNRYFYNQDGSLRQWRAGAVSTCAGLIAGGIIYATAACASHQCPF
jgi:hypothetical protein